MRDGRDQEITLSDSIRRAKIVSPTMSLGEQLRRVIDLGACNLNEITDPLEIYVTSETINALAVFFYKRRCRWTRLDKLPELTLDDVQRLLDQGIIRELTVADHNRTTLCACYSLMTVEELRDVTNSMAILKDRLVRSAVENHSSVLAEAIKVTSGFYAMNESVYMVLLRLHQFVFSACNYEPEDAAEYLISGVLGSVEFVEPAIKLESDEFCVLCWHQLKEVLDEMGFMAHHVPLGNSDEVFRSLHVASTLLLAVNRTCGCWMSKRVLDNCLRMVNLGTTLLERERRYEDALHYFKLALGVLESRLIIDVDDDDPNPCTRNCFHRARLLNRYCTDLCHLDRKNEALEELERVFSEPNGILWSSQSTRKTISMNRTGGLGAGLIHLYSRLSEPPRRWKPKVPVTLVEFPEERIRVKRVEGKSVETLSAEYYIATGEWTCAQHCENGLMHTVFGLLFSTNTTPRRLLDDYLITSNETERQRILHGHSEGECPKYAA